MHPITAIDWHALFVPTVSLLELVLRGSVMYLAVFAAMRVFRRESGALSTADLLVVVLVADAAQNAWQASIIRSPRARFWSRPSSPGIMDWIGWASISREYTGCSIPRLWS